MIALILYALVFCAGLCAEFEFNGKPLGTVKHIICALLWPVGCVWFIVQQLSKGN